MTFDEYIKNPMESSVMSNRSMYQELYTNKWNSLKLRENGVIIRTLYQDGDDFYIHYKIPSEVVPKFYYDTVIKFYLPKEKKSGVILSSLSNYDIQFFSNDPSFVYTFAHAFKKRGMLIKDLEFRMSELALKERGEIKNPKDELGYVKSIYFAYLETKASGLFSKNKWEAVAKKYNKNVWKDTVTHADDKIRDRQELGAAIAKKEKREKKEEKNNQVTPNHSEFNKPFEKPNKQDFGHFKKTDYNIISKAKDNIKKSFGTFKKSFK